MSNIFEKKLSESISEFTKKLKTAEATFPVTEEISAAVFSQAKSAVSKAQKAQEAEEAEEDEDAGDAVDILVTGLNSIVTYTRQKALFSKRQIEDLQLQIKTLESTLAAAQVAEDEKKK